MGSKMLTWVPHDEIASATSSENRFPVTLAASDSLYQCQVCIVVRKKYRANNFQAICKIHLKTCIRTRQCAFID